MGQVRKNFLRNVIFIKLLWSFFFLSASTFIPTPSKFPDCPDTVTSSNIGSLSAAVKEFFRTNDPSGNLEKIIFPEGVPTNKAKYNALGNLKNIYKTWHRSYLQEQEKAIKLEKEKEAAEESQRKLKAEQDGNNAKLKQIATKLGVNFTSPQKGSTPKKRGSASKRTPVRANTTDQLVEILGNALSAKKKEMTEVTSERDDLARKLQLVEDRITLLSPEAKVAQLFRQKSMKLEAELDAAQRKLQEVERLKQEAEAKLRSQLTAIENDMGRETLTQFQQLDELEKPFSTLLRRGKLVSETSALDLMYEAFLKMTADIRQQIDNHHVVCTAVESLNMVFKEVLGFVQQRDEQRGRQTFTIKFLTDTNLNKVLDKFDSAFLLAQEYMPIQFPEGMLDDKEQDEIDQLIDEYRQKHLAKIKKQIQDAKPEQRPGLIEDIFLNQFFDPSSAEMMRLKKSDPRDLSLECTRQFQEQIKRFEESGFYSGKAFTQIKGKLSKREAFLCEEIRKKDEEVYQQRLVILQAEIQKLEDDIAHLGNQLMVRQLFIFPAAFFLLSKPGGNITTLPFANLNRFETELYYLTKEEKEALFAHLFAILKNFSTYAGQYQESTLTKRTPLSPDDLSTLIKMTKESIRSHDDTKALPEFKPSALTLKDLSDFSNQILALRTGKTRDKAVTRRKQEALEKFKSCMADINAETLRKYAEIKKSELSEDHAFILTQMWIHRDKADLAFSGDIDLSEANELLKVETIMSNQNLYLELLKYSKDIDSLNSLLLKQLKEQLKDVSLDIIDEYKRENTAAISEPRDKAITSLLSHRSLIESASSVLISTSIADELLEAFRIIREDSQLLADILRFNKRSSVPKGPAGILPKVAISNGGGGNSMAGLLAQIQGRKAKTEEETVVPEPPKPAFVLKAASAEDQQTSLLAKVEDLQTRFDSIAASLEDADSIREEISTLRQDITASKGLMFAEMKIKNISKKLK